MNIYLPVWAIIAIVGGGLWHMESKWSAVGLWTISAMLAGFIHIGLLDPVVNQIKAWIA